MNFQDSIQSSETSFHMKSARFYCTPCNRQFSFLNPENGRATCPRCDNVSTRRVDSNTQNSNSTTNTNTRRQSSTQSQPTYQSRPQQEQQRQSRPSNQPYARQNVFSHGPGVLFQTAIPGVYFMPQYEQGYNNLGGLFGLGGMMGMNQGNMYYGNYNQASTQYYASPFDLFGGYTEVQPSRPVYMMGDQAITPEEYERLVEEFIRTDPNEYGPAPASEESIKQLREFEFSSKGCKSSECSVCQDGYKTGDKCVELPCEHNYHKDCVLEWLKRHDTCPICRKSSSLVQEDANRVEEEVAC